MPTSFSFAANTIVTPTYLALASLSRGPAQGVDDPAEDSAVALGQSVEVQGDVDVFAVSLLAGQTYRFDVDDGAGDGTGGSVDLEIDVIDQRGTLILSEDGSDGLDDGSVSTLDPDLTVTVNRSGTYFVAVHAQADEYQDGTFSFDIDGFGGVGDYGLVVSTPSLALTTKLSGGSDKQAFGNTANKVQAGAGNDKVRLLGGDDVATGQDGNDKLFGGDGTDELVGAEGNDKLKGDSGDDVLAGGDGNDKLLGGDDDDAISGGSAGDRLIGSDGADILWGEEGDDAIAGGDDDDFIRGGTGIDSMLGGAGADTFHFLPGEAGFDGDFNEDEILDFEVADVVDLSDLVLGTLAFVGAGGFTGTDQVRVIDYRDPAGDGYQEVRVTLDADASTELAFLVDTVGNFTLNSSDFIL